MTKTKNKIKDEKIEKIIKLIADSNLDKALKLADVSDVKSLLNIGILFG